MGIAHRAAFSESWRPDRITVLVLAAMLALVWPLTCAVRGWQLAERAKARLRARADRRA